MWDENSVRALTDGELVTLLQNARNKVSANKAAENVVKLCEYEVTRRGLDRMRPARRKNALKTIENELASEIGRFALELGSKYDLSPDTARTLSVGTPRFQPHRLTQNDGTAKIGGLQRSGRCRMDRYVSYRRGNDVISLNIWLPAEAKDEELEFQVFGPKALLENGSPLHSLRPGMSTEREMALFGWGYKTKSVDEAKALFADLIAKTVASREA